ncbi:single-stranded DNA-binding protein, putative [Plasmodium berghei]|uniref:Single-stranded DNA-binding protein, putative n=2 Tax=Plasmodium berghei TaxID=5821 RepID=A0A509AKB1_PLABA|nr:single-stranded DNA-binding protein, putative [Plasmodium berghei ANKA]CXI60842.1 single-stranded DNA-binding protein, putative [Plasmodium berghei]SCM23597.1 single-stranded DNA-binding protein, putative [Plasmodium berghei]SCN26677.1 single-stranded DNA-binding protein, putative [Plasmodium berghei]SCO60955.1 single-stranded DNA-binding protein, putative [Plasmodium berghei]SCO63016.1 single-stranded DNA-binding protein, putative [Plasmodium berghei]|eukprot:XP_034422293.1 single-stranded DNA-binding protein, putative [Plasmodium berghei ANKA]
MKLILLVSSIYLTSILKIWGYIGNLKIHTFNDVSNKRITSRKVNNLKINMQNDFNYENNNKRFYNNRPVMNEKSLNKITLIGRVGCEPDIKILNGGDKVATFSLATNEFWRDRNSNELKSKTDWHRIVVYDQNIVDLIDKYLRKGRRVYIQGSLHTRKWFGNDLNNQPRQITEIVLSYNKGDLIFLDDRRNFTSRNISNMPNSENKNEINNMNQNIGMDSDMISSMDNVEDDQSISSFDHNPDDNSNNFESTGNPIDKDEGGIYDKMNTQEFEE